MANKHTTVVVLIATVREAKLLDKEHKGVTERRDLARKKLVDLVGGDMLAAVQNAERRIGKLLTDPGTDLPLGVRYDEGSLD